MVAHGHAVWLLGEMLWGRLTRDAGRDPLWLAAELAVVLATQFLVWGVLTWSLHSPVRLLV